ncbi:MAG: hypothetical protein HOP32_16395 [Nitrospira sp.]|nr:hypothetical protein [Nitrospira sp.]
MATNMTEAEPQQSVLNGNVTHGDTLLKKAVKALGSRALDGRSTLAIELKAERQELIQALGGPTEVSPQEMAIIEMIAQKRIRRKPIQEWALLNRDALFNRRRRALAPIALQLEQLEESEVRLLKELGLKRRAKQVQSLSDYLNGTGKATTEQKATKATPQETHEDIVSSIGNASSPL